jgi:transcriptional regulator with XRE-family HTH domain
MSIKQLLKENNLTMYRCAKESGIPYTTLRELACGESQIEKCSLETAYKLAKTLGITVDDMIEKYASFNRPMFEEYKSYVCHTLKELGDLDFIRQTLIRDEITHYWEKSWYPEAFYLLAMLDHISKLNDIPLCNKYEDIRKQKLKEIVLPRDILLTKELSGKLDQSKSCIKEAIPEFLKYNIVESEIRNVC